MEKSLNSSEFFLKKTLIVGIGLIGGSIAKSFRRHKISQEIFAFDIDIESIEIAKNNSLVDGFLLLEEDLSSFDLIVVASTLGSYKKIFPIIFRNSKSETTIIDLGSVKNFSFIKLPKNFVACHPIAGSEKSGLENSKDDLFENKKLIICQEESDQIHCQKIEKIFTKIGSQIEYLDSKTHDKIFALVSHLPQFLSFLTKDLSPKNIQDQFLRKAFRLDNSSPEIWKDIFEFNEKNLQYFYEEFFLNLEDLIDNLTNYTHLNFIEDSVINDFTEQNFSAQFEKEFLEKNFSAIFFRILVIISLIKIKDLNNFKNYAGNGFKDFISLINILKCDLDFDFLVKKNCSKIQQKLLEIS